MTLFAGGNYFDRGLSIAGADHGLLSGLGDDDHPQYHDGSLAYTGDLDMGSNNIINANLVTLAGTEFTPQSANPGTPANTLYQDDGTNFTAGTLWWGSDVVFENGTSFGPPGTEQGGIDVGGTNFDAVVKVNDIGGSQDGMLILHRHSTSFASNLVFALTNDDTTAHTAVTPGQELGQTFYVGWSGTHYDIAARLDISVPSGSTVSPTSLAGQFEFYTTPDGSNTPTLALTIGSDQVTTLAGDLDMGGNDIINVGLVDGVDVAAHVADGTIHFTEASIDHGSISGLADDDHSQYHDGSLAYTGDLDMGANDIGNTGDVTLGSATAPATRLDVYTGSSTLGIRLRGTTPTTQIGDIYLNSNSSMVLTTRNATSGGFQFIEVAPKSTQFGLIIRDCSGVGTAYANLFMFRSFFTNPAYLSLTVNSGNDFNALVVTGGDRVGVGNLPLATAGKFKVRQASTTAAIPVAELEQLDIDDTFINFIGTSAADGSRSISSDTTEDSAKFGAVRVEINGVTKWIRIYDDES